MLPLIYVDEALGLERTPPDDGVMQVCIFCHGGRSVGLVVHRVIDVVEERIVGNDAGAYRRGIYTSAVIADRVTDVVDVPAIVDAALPGFFDKDRSAA